MDKIYDIIKKILGKPADYGYGLAGFLYLKMGKRRRERGKEA